MLLAGCADNMPPASTELGRIARISGVEETQLELFEYTQKRMSKPNDLRREFAGAGFDRIMERRCEIYRWKGRGWGSIFDKVMIVSVCGERIEATAGYIAP